MYKDSDKAAIVPYKCFEMRSRERVVWNRGADYTFFKAKVFKPALVDKLLHYGRLPGGTKSIVMGEGSSFSSSEEAIKPALLKYRLKVCNQQFNQEIYFALSFETNDNYLTEGWWSVKKGKCVELAVSSRLKRALNLEYGNMPRIHYYAETQGASPLYWSGGANGKSLCVSDGKAFDIIHKRADALQVTCNTYGQKKESFRLMDTPKTNDVYYKLTF